MKKEEFIKRGMQSEVAAAFFGQESRQGRVINTEGGEVGDIITLLKWADKTSKMKSDRVDENGNAIINEWLPIVCTGDAATVTLNTLVGSAKRNKYFPNPEGKTEITRKDGGVTSYVEDFASYSKILVLPRQEDEAALTVQEYFGKSLKRIAIAEDCGSFNQTFHLWAVLD